MRIETVNQAIAAMLKAHSKFSAWQTEWSERNLDKAVIHVNFRLSRLSDRKETLLG